ncbi:hypothetical protein Tco_0796304 [Tanacetum coccineum]
MRGVLEGMGWLENKGLARYWFGGKWGSTGLRTELAVTGLGLGLQSLHSLCQLHTNGLLKLIEGPFGLHSLHNYTVGLSRPIRWVKIASNSILQFRLRFDAGFSCFDS